MDGLWKAGEIALLLETPAQGVGTRELVVVGPPLVADGQGEEFRLFGE